MSTPTQNSNKKVEWNKTTRVIHPRIESLLVKILGDYNMYHGHGMGFYSVYFSYVNFWMMSPESSTKTAGVNVDKNGINFFYNKVFINKLTDKELLFLMIHEIDHLLFGHQRREKVARFTHEKSNKAQDFVINEEIIADFINTSKEPKDYVTEDHYLKFISFGLRLPEEYRISYREKVVSKAIKNNTFSATENYTNYRVPLIYEDIYMWIKGIEEDVVNRICLDVQDDMLSSSGYVPKYKPSVSEYKELMCRPDFVTYGNEWDTRFEDYDKEMQKYIFDKKLLDLLFPEYLKESNPELEGLVNALKSAQEGGTKITPVGSGQSLTITLSDEPTIVINEKYDVTNKNVDEFVDRYIDKVEATNYTDLMKDMLIGLCPFSKKGNKPNKHSEGFDEHYENDCDWEEAEARKNQIFDSVKARGLVKGSVESHIGNIKKTKKDYTREIVSSVNFIIGSEKEASYKRPSRKIEGLKGKIKMYGKGVNVILDTSGSMFDGSLETTLSTVFRNDLFVNLYQIDSQSINSNNKIKTIKQFKKLAILGGGGTELQPAVDHIKEIKDTRIKKMDLIILTDGYTDTLDLLGLNKVLIITTGKEPSISNQPKKLRILKIDN